MREAVQQIIYDEVITAVLRIINRLNLSSRAPFTEDEVVCVCTCVCIVQVYTLYVCMYVYSCIP